MSIFIAVCYATPDKFLTVVSVNIIVNFTDLGIFSYFGVQQNILKAIKK